MAMGLILKFPSNTQRQHFVEKLARERMDLWQMCQSSPVLPHLLMKNLTPEQERWLKEAVGPFGQVFADVQFQTFAK